jgi:hypothetical protein
VHADLHDGIRHLPPHLARAIRRHPLGFPFWRERLLLPTTRQALQSTAVHPSTTSNCYSATVLHGSSLNYLPCCCPVTAEHLASTPKLLAGFCFLQRPGKELTPDTYPWPAARGRRSSSAYHKPATCAIAEASAVVRARKILSSNVRTAMISLLTAHTSDRLGDVVTSRSRRSRRQIYFLHSNRYGQARRECCQVQLKLTSYSRHRLESSLKAVTLSMASH